MTEPSSDITADHRCEPTPEFLSRSCESCFSYGEKAHADGVVRTEAVTWALKEKRPLVFCAVCVVAGWNSANGEEAGDA